MVTLPASMPFFQLLPLSSNAQAKIEDMSRVLLNHVSQMPMNAPMKQVKSIQATFLVHCTCKYCFLVLLISCCLALVATTTFHLCVALVFDVVCVFFSFCTNLSSDECSVPQVLYISNDLLKLSNTL